MLDPRYYERTQLDCTVYSIYCRYCMYCMYCMYCVYTVYCRTPGTPRGPSWTVLCILYVLYILYVLCVLYVLQDPRYSERTQLDSLLDMRSQRARGLETQVSAAGVTCTGVGLPVPVHAGF